MEGADSVPALIAKRLEGQRACSNSNKPKARDAVGGGNTPYSALVGGSELCGLWTWMAVDTDPVFGDYAPKGYLTFSEPQSGRIVGHSYLESPMAEKSSGKSVLNVASLAGSRGGDDQIEFSITTGADRRGTISSKARLAGPDLLEGTSTVTAPVSGRTETITYRWKATRVK